MSNEQAIVFLAVFGTITLILLSLITTKLFEKKEKTH